MTDREKADFLDGYAVIKAASRAAARERKPAPSTESARSDKSGSRVPADSAPPRQVHVRRTVRPPSYEIRCYECGYTFRLTGKAQRTFCPRCRVILDMTDYSIETEWHQPIKTTGRVRLARHAVLDGAEVVAGEIILEGAVRHGRLQALRRLEVHPGASFDLSQVSARELCIASGATLRSRRILSAEDLDIAGRLEARIRATGRVLIRSGGLLKGEITAPRLIVEEGGGLRARCTVTREPPDGAPPG